MLVEEVDLDLDVVESLSVAVPVPVALESAVSVPVAELSVVLAVCPAVLRLVWSAASVDVAEAEASDVAVAEDAVRVVSC